MKKSLVLFVLFSALSCISSAQAEGSAFTLTGMGVSTPFARDYQALGLSVGNLDITPQYNRYGTIGMGQSAFSMHSEVLNKPILRQNIFRKQLRDLSYEEQKNLALEFAQSKNAVDADIMGFGFSVRTERIGTFAFRINDKISLYSQLGKQASELLWLGNTSSYFDSLVVEAQDGSFDTIPNTGNIDPATVGQVVAGITSLSNAQSLSDLLQGTKFGFTWYREFNFGYGKRVFKTDNWQFHIGGGLKFLIGQGKLDIEASNGSATAFGALSPIFNIDYGQIANQNPNSIDNDASKFRPVGYGWGYDLGTSIVFKEKFILSAAVNDIGYIRWDGNTYQINDAPVTHYSSNGLENVDFYEQIQELSDSTGLLEWQGSTSVTTRLASTARFGFGYDNGKSIKIGIDFIAPLSDALAGPQEAAISVGGEYAPMPWLHLQIGYSQGGNYSTKIPIGIYFSLGDGVYEFGVASRDLVTFFRDNDPTISLASGFLRFRF